MRKQFVLFVTVILLFPVSGSGQSHKKGPNLAQAKSTNVKLPEELIHQMARDDNEIKSCQQEQGGNTTKVAENFSARLLDLNGDRKPEWIIDGIPGPCSLCGNHECGGFIYREVAGSYELLLLHSGGIPLNTFTNGYRDLKAGSGTPVWRSETIYKYNGRRYKAVECLEYKNIQSRNGQGRWKLTSRAHCPN